jgi:O-antigen ligase
VAYWQASIAVPVLLLLLSTSCFQYCLTTASGLQTTSQIRSASGHAEAWKFSMQTIREHPLFGVGGFNSPMAWMRYRARSTRPFAPIVFNWVLQSWQDGGAVSLFAFAILLGTSLRRAYATARSAGNARFERQVCALWAAGLIAVLVRDLSYSSITLDAGVMLVLWTGFAIAAPEASPGKERETQCSASHELVTVG